MAAKFDSMDAQFDEMGAMFEKFPGLRVQLEGDLRDSIEYKTFRLALSAKLDAREAYASAGDEARKVLETSLNLLGMEGWDLVAIHGNCAIFSRVKEGA